MNGDDRLFDLTKTVGRDILVAWLLVVVVVFVAAASIAVGDILWGGFAFVVVILAIVPTVLYRDPRIVLPWQVLVLAALPVFGRIFAADSIIVTFSTYLGLAALALIIAVELDSFTSVRMSSGFAVTFVIVATLAATGIWAVLRWSLDITLGTTFLLDPALSESAIEWGLMWEFVYSMIGGLLGGLIFELYFRRRRPTLQK